MILNIQQESSPQLTTGWIIAIVVGVILLFGSIIAGFVYEKIKKKKHKREPKRKTLIDLSIEQWDKTFEKKRQKQADSDNSSDALIVEKIENQIKSKQTKDLSQKYDSLIKEEIEKIKKE